MNDLRPTKFDDILGQASVLDALQISVDSAKKRNTCLGHMLFYGPAGTGKTTLANAISNEMGCSLQTANGANLRSIKSAVAYLMKIEKDSILFIDEIHRMTPIVEEFLYPVMEDFKIDMAVSEEKTISVPIPSFTLVGATTEIGLLAKPFIDRFKNKHTLKLYSDKDLRAIAEVNISKLEISMSDDAMNLVAKISKGTPRIINSTLEWLRDYKVAKNLGQLSIDDVTEAMKIRGVDTNGLTDVDRQYLRALSRSDIPLGVGTIAATTGIDKKTIEDVIEPWLLRNEIITKTPRGRILNRKKAYK
jgi:Holliday junction DNA helicase RuvB|tara:strand:- start:10662 stop:11573 length:912 start_codon:yes stop_codon:yes gene_type:complete